MREPMRVLSPIRWAGYGVALGATLLVLVAQLFLARWLGDSLLPLAIAVLAAAWYAGWRAGVLSTLLGTVLGFLLLLQPAHGEFLRSPRDRARMVVFVVLGLMISRVCEAFRAASGRLEAERARLRKSDAFHEAIADLSTDFAFSARVEPDGAIVPEAVTEGFSALLGYRLEDLAAGGGWKAILHPDEREAARRKAQRLLRGHRLEGEARHLAQDGRVLRLRYRVRPLWDERGRVVHVYGAYRDVTREREAQENAREREQQLRLVADNAPVRIAHCDAEQRFKFVNRPFAARFGLEPQQLLGRTIVEVIGDEAYALIAGYVDAALSGAHVEFEADVPYAGVGTEAVRVAYEPELDAEGRTVGFVAAIVSIAEQRRAQEALRESEARFRQMTEAMPHIAFTARPDGTVEYVNSQWYRFSGRPADESFGLGWMQVFHPEDYADTYRRWTRSLREGEPFEAEYRFRSGDGTFRWHLCRALPVRDRSGRISMWVGTSTDVHEQRRLTDQLATERGLLDAVFASSPIGLAVIDRERRFLRVNDVLAGIDGFAAVEHVGRFAAEVAPGLWAGLESLYAQVLASGGPVTDYGVSRKGPADGAGERHWLASGYPIRTRDGVVGVGIAVVDVTEQKRTQEALERSERVYRAIGESIDYGVWVCDPAGRNVYASESFLDLVGLSQEQCSGFGWAQALHPEDAERTLSAWTECVRTGGKWDAELRYLGSDGQPHPVLARGVQVKDAAGRVVAWAGINLDLRRLKDAEEGLRAADRRKDEFLATLAHELRNPLNPIRSAVQVLRMKGPRDPEQEWSRDVIDRQVGHLTRLIDDLLDISRISRGKLELRRETVELREVLRGALEAVRPLVEQLGHELDLEIPEGPLYVEGDPVRLTQVFLNLLNNAAKYTDRGGVIGLAVERGDGKVTISVRDTGVGIAAEKLPHLFEMFYQVDRSLEKAQGGLGIGLSLVKQLVAMHGGRISARSEGVGRGSEFVVELPLRPGLPAPAAGPPVAADRPRHPIRRILVVDDNADSASSLALVLQLAGHEVDTARDGEEALWKAAETRPDVVLLDIGMPKLNGYEVCRRIRSEPWGREMLLVAQTGWGQQEDRQRTREAGFDAHLVKPIEPSALERLIEGLGKDPDGDGDPGEGATVH